MQLNFRFPSPQTVQVPAGQVPAGQVSNANPQFQQNTNLLYSGLSYPTFNQVPAQFTNPINYVQQAQLLSPPISAFFPFNSLQNSNPALYTANLQLQQTILQNPAQAFIAQPHLAIPALPQTAQVAQSLNFVPAYNPPANASSLQGNALLSLPTAKPNFMIEQWLLNSSNAASPVTLPQIPSLPAPIPSTSSNKRAAQPQSQAQPQHSSQSQPPHHHQQPQAHHSQQASTAVPLSNPHLDFTLAAERAANAVLLQAIPKDPRTSTIQHLPAAVLPQPLPQTLNRPQPQPLPEPHAPLQQQAPLLQPIPILQPQTQPPVAARVAQPIPVTTTIARPVTTTTFVPPIPSVSTVVSAPSAPHTTGGSLTIRVPLNAVAAFNSSSAASSSTITPVTTLPSSPIRSPPAASPPQNAPFSVSSVNLAPSFSIGLSPLPSTMATSTAQQLQQQQQPTRSIASSSAPVPPKYRHAKPVPIPGSPKGGAGGSSRSRKKCNELEALSKWQVKDAAYSESAETPATYTSAEPEVDLVDRVKRPRRAALSAQTALQLASFPRAISDDTSSTVVAKRSGLLITVTFKKIMFWLSFAEVFSSLLILYFFVLY